MPPRPEHVLQQERLRSQFLRKLEQLHFELSIEAPRRVLDYLVEHLDDLLEWLDCTWDRDRLRERLVAARSLVATRHNLRVVR